MTLIRFIASLALVSFSLTPAFAYAAAIDANASVRVNVGASTSGSGAETSDSNDINAGLILITHDGAKALFEGAATTSHTTAVSSATELRTHANALAADDEHVTAIALADDRVALTYREPAKLFGFIRIEVPITVSVHASGNTSVSYPWYHFFVSSDQTSLQVRAKAAAEKIVVPSADASAKAQLSASAQARLLDSLHAVMQSEFEARASTK